MTFKDKENNTIMVSDLQNGYKLLKGITIASIKTVTRYEFDELIANKELVLADNNTGVSMRKDIVKPYMSK